MALSVKLYDRTGSTIKVYATGFSSSVTKLKWYIDDSYDGTITSDDRDWPYWEFTGLAPNTKYFIKVYFYSNSSSTALDEASGYFSTTKTDTGEIYYARLILKGNGGTADGYSSLRFPYDDVAWGTGFDGGADLFIKYDGGQFKRNGYTLVGFSESRDASPEDYDVIGISGEYEIRAKSTDASHQTTVKLYAVWSSGRPKDWKWTSTVSQGSTLKLTATEWKNFVSRIKDFAKYKGVTLNSTQLTNATSGVATGQPMLASQAKAVRSLINQLSPPTSVPSTVSSGTSIITASFINGLKDSLNSIK